MSSSLSAWDGEVNRKSSPFCRFGIDTASPAPRKFIMVTDYLLAYQIFRSTQFSFFTGSHTSQIRIEQLVQLRHTLLASGIRKKETDILVILTSLQAYHSFFTNRQCFINQILKQETQLIHVTDHFGVHRFYD